ncbi:hypothetical protein HAX54_022151, partial [Datura stramonium]|nr:hypothetical protein [Datura stramonium]
LMKKNSSDVQVVACHATQCAKLLAIFLLHLHLAHYDNDLDNLQDFSSEVCGLARH